MASLRRDDPATNKLQLSSFSCYCNFLSAFHRILQDVGLYIEQALEKVTPDIQVGRRIEEVIHQPYR